ncbi:MAG: PA0069 family radical SAM protein [Sinimarinibacterium sp.]
MAGPQESIKGRGATINPEGRFETRRRQDFDDGWTRDEDPPSSPITELFIDHARSIITRNDSPDIPFTQSVNPYRGCEHGCVYCLAGETPILMADGSLRPLAELRTGAQVYGTVRDGWYRRYVPSRVLAHWSVIKPAYRIGLEDGTVLIAGGDHRFLTERGWKFVADALQGGPRRAHLTSNNKLMGTGAFSVRVPQDGDYQLGYLCGLIRGDGLLGEYLYTRPGRSSADQYQFRLALCDLEALNRARDYLQSWGVPVYEFVFAQAGGRRKAMHGIRNHGRQAVAEVRKLIDWPGAPSRTWCAGFLAGIFDAEGSYSEGVLRISNTDHDIIDWITRCLNALGFGFAIEQAARTLTKPIQVVRLIGGLSAHLRFFHTVDPAISRKRSIAGQAVKSSAQLKVVSVEPLGRSMRLYDITTETEDFIANGVVSHNCYARPAHAYLNLSPGLDFETKLFYKPNAAALLEEELRKPGYKPEWISLGANTDPWQPVERKLGITRSILEVLARFRHPVGIVTKGAAIIERDLELLAEMARDQLVMVAISVTTLDPELKRTLEPRASAPATRLRVMRQLAEAGVPVMVMFSPVIPCVNDAEMERVLKAASEAGARHASYVMLRLPHEVKDLFRDWLQTHLPLRAEHVMSLVQQMRGGKDYDSDYATRMSGQGVYAGVIAQRFRTACRRLGLNTERFVGLSTAHFRVPPRSGDQLGLGF